MQTTIVRIAIKLRLFHILLERNVSVVGNELAEKIRIDHILLLRILRYLVAMHAIGESDVDSYFVNNVIKNLVFSQLEAGINYIYNLIEIVIMTLPSFLAKNNYRNPIDSKKCAFQEDFQTENSLFE